ncbi:unnamed protein product [Strongylus vulgaris]|uniref:Uncharacterized protein n=1 Tax=Strongylus vulgaris TaxID=40348 RepID=A0A3P7JI24_STRVU|nr:unnamed protein product [Strongylus vulgaris]
MLATCAILQKCVSRQLMEIFAVLLTTYKMSLLPLVRIRPLLLHQQPVQLSVLPPLLLPQQQPLLLRPLLHVETLFIQEQAYRIVLNVRICVKMLSTAN